MGAHNLGDVLDRIVTRGHRGPGRQVDGHADSRRGEGKGVHAAAAIDGVIASGEADEVSPGPAGDGVGRAAPEHRLAVTAERHGIVAAAEVDAPRLRPPRAVVDVIAATEAHGAGDVARVGDRFCEIPEADVDDAGDRPAVDDLHAGDGVAVLQEDGGVGGQRAAVVDLHLPAGEAGDDDPIRLRAGTAGGGDDGAMIDDGAGELLLGFDPCGAGRSRNCDLAVVLEPARQALCDQQAGRLTVDRLHREHAARGVGDRRPLIGRDPDSGAVGRDREGSGVGDCGGETQVHALRRPIHGGVGHREDAAGLVDETDRRVVAGRHIVSQPDDIAAGRADDDGAGVVQGMESPVAPWLRAADVEERDRLVDLVQDFAGGDLQVIAEVYALGAEDRRRGGRGRRLIGGGAVDDIGRRQRCRLGVLQQDAVGRRQRDQDVGPLLLDGNRRRVPIDLQHIMVAAGEEVGDDQLMIAGAVNEGVRAAPASRRATARTGHQGVAACAADQGVVAAAADEGRAGRTRLQDVVVV